MRYKMLYTGVFFGLLLLVLASLGSGIWGIPADYSSWQYRMFRGICHQMAERSFQISGVPMAVNSRCFGVFTGLLWIWLVIPVIKEWNAGKHWQFTFLLVALMLQIVDTIAGQFSVWNSSNFSRFLMGNILGAVVVCMIADCFKAKPKIKQK